MATEEKAPVSSQEQATHEDLEPTNGATEDGEPKVNGSSETSSPKQGAKSQSPRAQATGGGRGRGRQFNNRAGVGAAAYVTQPYGAAGAAAFPANGWGAQAWGFPAVYGRDDDAPLSKQNIYIPGLPPTTTDDELIRLCEKYGKIVSAKAIVDRGTGQCKGYGFVMFEKPANAQKAVQALKQAGYQVSFAKESYTDRMNASKAQQDFDSTNLYMANLPLTFSEQDLEKLLEGWGRVLSCRILRDPNGVSRGVGFTRLETREQCDQIIRTFNQKMALTSQPLQVRYADTFQQKRQRMHERKQRTIAGQMGIPGYVPMQMMQHPVGSPQAPSFFPPRGPNMPMMPATASNWMNPMYPMAAAPGMVPATQGQMQYGGMPTTMAGSNEGADQQTGMGGQSMGQLTNQMAGMSINQGMVPSMMVYPQAMAYPPSMPPGQAPPPSRDGN
eukprot:comp22906_c1_seq1/m.36233 comp22906_c1_seq1/g.36233  ORF comp22906_c1_seq1/g.36233 comp22906_c1_seq1/m.36233 type:complete len:443 (-) comp22906_c1_seq1:636-1964(-)